MAKVFKGFIRINGRDALRMSRREIARLVSYVPQNYVVTYPIEHSTPSCWVGCRTWGGLDQAGSMSMWPLML